MTDATSSQETLAFDLIGGEARVRELVDRFYDLMGLEPEFAVLRGVHPPSLDSARHLPFEIGTQERDQWMRCMALAMQDVGLAEALQMRLMQAFWQTADWMRNVPR